MKKKQGTPDSKLVGEGGTVAAGKTPAPVKKRAPRKRARAKAAEPAATGVDTGPPESDTTFPIVGVGASAGGLEAFQDLLKELPTDIGMAFVLVQHLDPRHESMLTSLLGRVSRVPVHEVRDGMRVEPNQVYVIPPNRNLGLLHGTLQLLPREEGRGRYLPIDYFFSRLAEDWGSKAIGIVLSGTASDGTLGLKAIKAASGITFAQDEQSAQYGGMPASAVAAGVVDFVMPPRQIARELNRGARRQRRHHGAGLRGPHPGLEFGR